MRRYIFPTTDELKVALARPKLDQQDLEALVKNIFDEVNISGDEAVRAYATKFDQVELSELRVSDNEFLEAEQKLNPELKIAIQQAASNIRKFHAAQKEESKVIETQIGVSCWRRSVGDRTSRSVYSWRDSTAFSTVLMLGIPAVLAGCKKVVLCTPCGKDGKVHPAVLYAASITGVTEVYKIGGVQAIASMTLGTESVPAVYKIFGPGNQYVTAAKQYAQKLGVAIDMPAGPSEVMVVADDSGDPEFIASDLLSQAEHGADSQVVLVSASKTLVDKVETELSKQLKQLSRKEIAQKALENSSAIVVQKEEILSLINEYGPEHLILQTTFNDELVDGVINAGSVFIGQYTPESAGDYASGTNHTLPTNGYAKQFSGVSLDSFVKKITFQQISETGIRNIGKTIELMAEAEGLDAHKNAVTVRLNRIKENDGTN